MHAITIFSEPILSSIFPRDKHPIIPDKLMKTPSFKISFSENPNKRSDHGGKGKYAYNRIIKKK